MMIKKQEGLIEFITGCMFAGKTETLFLKIRKLRNLGKNVTLFKTKLDKRNSSTKILTHSGDSMEAKTISTIDEINKMVTNEKLKINVIAIDEIHFFKKEIVSLFLTWKKLGKKIIVAGLDLDIFARPFKTSFSLMKKADQITYLKARCFYNNCKSEATRTHLKNQEELKQLWKKIKNGEEVILPGGEEKYKAVCVLHHQKGDLDKPS